MNSHGRTSPEASSRTVLKTSPWTLSAGWTTSLLAFLLILGLLVLRWPGGLELRSDDYLAIQYVQDWGRVAQDFTGPQYDIQRLALFYRPLITLSIAIDARLGGNEAFVPLLANLLIHLVNAGLLFLLLKRFFGRLPALCATGWWAWQSGHLEAISWMVGRVDTHATFFFLLALELDLRYREARSKHLWPALLAFVLACMTKELALTLPGALFLLWLMRDSSTCWWPRVRKSLAPVLPYSILLLLVLISRRIFLGEEIGGYATANPDLVNALMFWRPFLPRGAASSLGVSGILVACLSLAALLLFLNRLRRHWRSVPLLLALSIVLSLPTAGARGSSGSERYDYLPSASLAGMLALGGPLPPLLMIGADLFTSIPEREQLHEVSAEVRRYRAQARDRIEGPQTDLACFIEAPLEIHGLVAFSIGTDRLGLPPFGKSSIPVLPRRAVDPSLETQSQPPRIGELRPDYRGPPVLDLEHLGEIGSRKIQASFGLGELEPASYGVLAAGSQGWFRVRVPARKDGRLDVLSLLESQLDGSQNHEALLMHLWPSAEISVDPRPLLYLEAFDAEGQLMGSSSQGIHLPLARDFGRGLVALRQGVWLILCLTLISLALVPFWRSRRSNPGSKDRRRDPSEEAN